LTFHFYIWKSPRDMDATSAETLLKRWHEDGGDPHKSPFEASTDVGWFYRELMKDLPGIDASSDAVPNPSSTPIWLSGTQEPPARMVTLRLSPGDPRDELDSIFGLATKYDLVVFDRRSGRIHLPLEALAAHADATFWPAGATQAAVAGGLGGVIAVVAWFLGIPVVSGLLMLVGGFMFAMAAYTFIHQART